MCRGIYFEIYVELFILNLMNTHLKKYSEWIQDNYNTKVGLAGCLSLVSDSFDDFIDDFLMTIFNEKTIM